MPPSKKWKSSIVAFEVFEETFCNCAIWEECEAQYVFFPTPFIYLLSAQLNFTLRAEGIFLTLKYIKHQTRLFFLKEKEIPLQFLLTDWNNLHAVIGQRLRFHLFLPPSFIVPPACCSHWRRPGKGGGVNFHGRLNLERVLAASHRAYFIKKREREKRGDLERPKKGKKLLAHCYSVYAGTAARCQTGGPWPRTCSSLIGRCELQR